MATAPVLNYATLKNHLAQRKFAPVYLVHGEQGYYIDEAVKLFEELVPEADRDFNLYNLYAPEVTPAQVSEVCRRYPMMAEYQVVILREAQTQSANYHKELAKYVEHPSPTTILVICGRGASIKQADLKAAIKSTDALEMDAPALKDYQVGGAIAAVVKEAGFNVDPKALSMLTDHVGSDLSRVRSEVDKLKVVLPSGAMITPEVVERHIGLSKDYNNFELISAIGAGDELKAMRIVGHFAANPKANPIFPTLGELFRYFSRLLIILYTPDKSQDSLMKVLGFRHPRQLTDLMAGLRRYNAWHAIELIRAIRRCDAAAKGVDSRADGHALLRDLVYHILHPTGRI